MSTTLIKSRGLIASLAIAMAAAASFRCASADQGQFSLSGGSPAPVGHGVTADMLSSPPMGQYASGPWTFKLTAPSAANPEHGLDVVAGNVHPGLAGSEAAVSYNIDTGVESTFGFNLTGKVSLADPSPGIAYGINNYTAQANAYQSLDRFQAQGSLGYLIHQGAPEINMNRVIYASVGASYQLNEQISGGVDFRLAQSPIPLEQGQRRISAYVSHNLDNNFKAKGYLLQDYSNGIEDRSVGAAVSYGF